MRIPVPILLLTTGLLVAIPTRSIAQDANAVFRSANEDFSEGDYSQAALKYRGLVEEGLVSPDLYYNLGTAEFRNGQPGQAMLWLRRAQLLDSNLPEVRQNVEYLRTRLAFLEFNDTGFDQVVRSLPRSLPLWAMSIATWLAALSLAAGFAIPRLAPNRSGLIALAVVLLLVTILANRVGHYRSTRLAPENFATVVTSDAAALTAPVPGSKAVIELPPGSEVRILQESGPWIYVDIPGNLRGWVREEVVEPVWPVSS